MSAIVVESYLQISESAIIAAAALLTFDYCLTLGKEVKWLYGTKWTPARIHFTSSRYLPFVAIAVAIPTSRVQLQVGPDTDYCGPLGTATNVLYYLCIVLAEAMLIVRTYAFWKRERRVLIGMCTFGAACILVAIVVSETIPSSPANSVDKTLNCLGVEGTLATAIQYICLILYEMGMLGLTCVAYRKMSRRNPPGPLIRTLYRDGVTYVAAILAFSVINAVFTLAAPVQYSDILNSPQMVMHSILASRIFFNLRETTRREQTDVHSVPLSEFHVASGSSGSSNCLGSTSLSGRIDPKPTDFGRVIDLTGEPVVQG